MQDNRASDGDNGIVPYGRSARRRDAQRSGGVVRMLAFGLAILLVATAAGYGFGRWRAHPYIGRHELVESTAAAKSEAPATDTVTGSTGELTAGAPDTVVVINAYRPPEDFADRDIPMYGGTTTDTASMRDFQTLTPPEEPPLTIAPPVPSDAVLAELLYGQELVAKTLVANYGWRVESGEIIELKVDQVWDDPADKLHGVYITFVAMAEGKGIRASGLLRYFGDGTEGNGYLARDFMPSSVVRVGSW